MTQKTGTETGGTGGRRVCLFAQYHREGPLPTPSIRYMAALVEAGFEVHAALSGSSEIAAADRSILERIGARIRTRRNGGLDFGAWQDLIRQGAADGADEILLANDSVFGPFAPLAPILRAMEGFDAWGMVESREGRPHLQSWFVWMSGAAFHSRAVARLFDLPFAAMTKPEIITHGELGLSAAFEAEGLDVGARYRARFRIRPSALVATNPMHFRWRALLSSGLVPFLKVELLRCNPSRILGVEDWERVLTSLGVADVPMLRAALAASGDAMVADRVGLDARQTMLQLALREDRLRVVRDLLGGRRQGQMAGREPGHCRRMSSRSRCCCPAPWTGSWRR